MTNMQTADITPSMAWSGSRYIDMLEPRVEDISIYEIAVGLVRENRYGGAATSRPWSVAKHLVQGAWLARADGLPIKLQREIFAHDFPEYMLRDIIAPLKRVLPGYAEIESAWWAVIADKFDLPLVPSPAVKRYDAILAATEKAELISAESGRWPGEAAPSRLDPDLLEMDEGRTLSAFLGEAAYLGFT